MAVPAARGAQPAVRARADSGRYARKFVNFPGQQSPRVKTVDRSLPSLAKIEVVLYVRPEAGALGKEHAVAVGRANHIARVARRGGVAAAAWHAQMVINNHAFPLPTRCVMHPRADSDDYKHGDKAEMMRTIMHIFTTCGHFTSTAKN